MIIYRIYLVVYDCNPILLYVFTWGENLAQVSVIPIYTVLEAQHNISHVL